MATPVAATTSTVSGIFKTMYPDEVVHDQTNKKIQVLQDFESQGWAVNQGGQFQINISTNFSDGTGFRNEGDDVPEADFDRNEWANFTFTEYLGVVRVSGKAVDVGGSIVDPAKYAYRRMRTKMRLDYEKSFFIPKSGAYAVLDTAAASAVSFTVSNGQLLNTNMRIDVLVTSSGEITDGVENALITALSTDQDTGVTTVTVAAPGLGAFANVSTTYSVFRTNSYGKHPHGFPDVISTSNPDTGNYGGIDRTTTTEWQSVSRTAGDVALTAELIDYLRGEVDLTSGIEPDFVYVHPYPFRDLMAETVSAKRFSDVQDMDPWGTTIKVGQTRVIPTRFCPYDRAYAITKNTWRMAHPMKTDGKTPLYGIWKEGVGDMTRVVNKNMYEALWVAYREVVCNQPNANGVLTNILWSPKGSL